MAFGQEPTITSKLTTIRCVRFVHNAWNQEHRDGASPTCALLDRSNPRDVGQLQARVLERLHAERTTDTTRSRV